MVQVCDKLTSGNMSQSLNTHYTDMCENEEGYNNMPYKKVASVYEAYAQNYNYGRWCLQITMQITHDGFVYHTLDMAAWLLHQLTAIN